MQISSGTIIQSKSILTWINFQLSDKPHSTWTYQPLRSMRAFFRRNINWTNTSYHHTESAEPLKPNRYQEPPKNIIPTRSTAERNCWTNIKDFLGGLCNKYTISRLVTDKSNNCICLNKRLTARNVRIIWSRLIYSVCSNLSNEKDKLELHLGKQGDLQHELTRSWLIFSVFPKGTNEKDKLEHNKEVIKVIYNMV